MTESKEKASAAPTLRRGGLRRIQSVILPGPKEAFSRKTLMLDLPRWGGELEFRHATAGESTQLKHLYESAWGPGIHISTGQIEAKIRNFPQGQIVGCKDGKPASMINIMLSLFDPAEGVPAGYDNLTSDKTFEKSVPPEEFFRRLNESKGGLLPVAYCVSIAVPEVFKKSGFAYETLNYARLFSIVNGLFPVPYSAPRGFGRALEANPGLDILDYLHMTRRNRGSFYEYLGKMGVRIPKVHEAFWATNRHGELERMVLIPQNIYEKYNAMSTDDPRRDPEDTVYARFLREDAARFEDLYQRRMTIEDFCVLSGRGLLDPVIGMHLGNGSRFLRDGKGGIIAVFPDSRPEDTAAAGYNIAVTYVYHRHFGHDFLPEH